MEPRVAFLRSHPDFPYSADSGPGRRYHPLLRTLSQGPSAQPDRLHALGAGQRQAQAPPQPGRGDNSSPSAGQKHSRQQGPPSGDQLEERTGQAGVGP